MWSQKKLPPQCWVWHLERAKAVSACGIVWIPTGILASLEKQVLHKTSQNTLRKRRLFEINIWIHIDMSVTYSQININKSKTKAAWPQTQDDVTRPLHIVKWVPYKNIMKLAEPYSPCIAVAFLLSSISGCKTSFGADSISGISRTAQTPESASGRATGSIERFFQMWPQVFCDLLRCRVHGSFFFRKSSQTCPSCWHDQISPDFPVGSSQVVSVTPLPKILHMGESLTSNQNAQNIFSIILIYHPNSREFW